VKPEPENRETPPGASLMYVRCASCGRWLDVKPGRLEHVSHGLCEECFRTEMAKLKNQAPPESPA